MRGVARQKVGWQGRRPANSDLAYWSMARRLSLLFSLLVGLRIRRDGVSELQFNSVAKGIYLCRCSLRVARSRRNP